MHAKLTEGVVSFIKRRLSNGEATDTIATAYGIGLRQIQRIAKGQAWKHIT
jgi:hypothetical protein